MIWLTNAFSITMVRLPVLNETRQVTVRRISALEAGEFLRNHDFRSAYGHEDTAWHLSRYLQIPVTVQRIQISLQPDDVLIIARVAMDREYRGGFRKCPKWSFFRVEVPKA